MSNGVRRTAAAGLKASAGSNVSKRYKTMQKKLGVKSSLPGSMLEAWRGLKGGVKKLPKMDFPGFIDRKGPKMLPRTTPKRRSEKPQMMLAKRKAVKKKSVGMPQAVGKSIAAKPRMGVKLQQLLPPKVSRFAPRSMPAGPSRQTPSAKPSRARRIGRRVRGAVKGLVNAPREFAQGLKGRKAVR